MKQHVKTFESFLNEALAKPDLYYTVVYLNNHTSVKEEDFATREEADGFAKTLTAKKNTYAYVFEMPKDKKIYEEYWAILPFKSKSRYEYVGWGISMGVDIFNKSALEAYITEIEEHYEKKKSDGEFAGIGWKSNLSNITKGLNAVKGWVAVMDQLPPSDLDRSNDNYDPMSKYAEQWRREAEEKEERKKKEDVKKMDWSAASIIGRYTTIGNLQIAENDLPSKYYMENDVEEALAKIGGGWRLPTEEECAVLYENYGKIGNWYKTPEGGDIGTGGEDWYWCTYVYMKHEMRKLACLNPENRGKLMFFYDDKFPSGACVRFVRTV
jgi:hypothetical protein